MNFFTGIYNKPCHQLGAYSELYIHKTLDEGVFRISDLVTHLKNHKVPNIVSISEDATRVIGRVDYDTETDRCVGFVLPVDQHGLPLIDSFTATSFSAIESMFQKNAISKYAVVYVAQPLSSNAPPFVLACLGTDNKFTAKHVLQRWNYLYHECAKQGITVLNFSGNGDSRIMKSMRISTSLMTDTVDPNLPLFSPAISVPKS